MTDDIGTGPPSIGKRIAAYRKYMGIETAAELAAKIPNDRITTSVIQNIESGRKADLAVSQLLDIAHGIGVSPMVLLVPVGRPFDLVDLPNVSDSISAMTSSAFDRWMSMTDAHVPSDDPKQATVRYIARSMRELVKAVPEAERAAADPDLYAEPIAYEDEGRMMVHDASEGAQMALFHARATVDRLYSALERYNVDLSWVKRPWVASQLDQAHSITTDASSHPASIDPGFEPEIRSI